MHADARRLIDRLAAAANYRAASETVPVEGSLLVALRAEMRPGSAEVNVLGEDLWSVADLFYE